MYIEPVNTNRLDAISLTEMEENNQITDLASELLLDAHGEVKVDVSFSLDFPKIAEVLKAQAIATGQSPELLWGLAVLESDPTQTVNTLCEFIEAGMVGAPAVISLHVLHEKAPADEMRLINAFAKAAELGQLSEENLGTFANYCLQKGHSEAFDRLMTFCECLAPTLSEWDAEELIDSLATAIIQTEMLSGLMDSVRPLSDLDSNAKARLGSLITVLERSITFVEPENYYTARMLQGGNIETIVAGVADPIYQAMIYDIAALTSAIRNPEYGEELLGRSIQIVGEEPRELSYRDGVYISHVSGVPLEIVRGVIAIGYAFQDPQVGVERAMSSLEGILDAEDLADAAVGTFAVLGIALYQGRKAEALQLLDALLSKVQELDMDDINPIVSGALAALFPERKEALAPYISEEMPQLPELRLSLEREDVLQTVTELSQIGLFDLGDTETEALSFAAALLATLN